jgi:hypothetical protein
VREQAAVKIAEDWDARRLQASPHFLRSVSGSLLPQLRHAFKPT